MIFARGAGCVEQPFSPAKANDAPISKRKRRRVTGSVHSDAWSGNSRWIISWNSGVSRNSSRLRQ